VVMGRLRELVNKVAPSTIGKALARRGVKADHITYTGLALAALAPIVAALREGWAVPALVALSSLMDVIDGAVARASGRTTPFGSYLDSVTDRASDAMFITAIAVLGANAYLSLVTLMFSFLVSYARSKGELLGVKMEGVGLMERGERAILLLLASIAAAAGSLLACNIIMLIIAVLSAVTVIQRSVHIKRSLEAAPKPTS
jgi:Phosphatidylglycerophosphate synthase